MSVIITVDGIGENDLLEVGEAGDGLCLGTGLRKGGQQHGGQDRDDGDDDEEFDQREVLFHVGFPWDVWIVIEDNSETVLKNICEKNKIKMFFNRLLIFTRKKRKLKQETLHR